MQWYVGLVAVFSCSLAACSAPPADPWEFSRDVCNYTDIGTVPSLSSFIGGGIDGIAYRACIGVNCRDVELAGQPCGSADDIECQSAWAYTPAAIGWGERGANGVPDVGTRLMIVYSQRGRVHYIADSEQLKKFVGYVRDASEAQLLLTLGDSGVRAFPYTIPCMQPNMRETRDGFEFLVHSYEMKANESWLRASVIRVDARGTVDELYHRYPEARPTSRTY